MNSPSSEDDDPEKFKEVCDHDDAPLQLEQWRIILFIAEALIIIRFIKFIIMASSIYLPLQILIILLDILVRKLIVC